MDLFVIPYYQNKDDQSLFEYIVNSVKYLLKNIPDWSDNFFDEFYKSRFQMITSMNNLAKKYKGKFLSNSYYGANKVHQWQCQNGHRWGARSSHIKQGNWCPICAKFALWEKTRNNIEDIQEFAKQHNGELLTPFYRNNKTSMQWCCSNGHQWWATLNTMRTRLSTSITDWCLICKEKVPRRSKMKGKYKL